MENELLEKESQLKRIETIRKLVKVRFKDLSVWLKLSIIMGWVFACELILAFLFGFFAGFFEVL